MSTETSTKTPMERMVIIPTGNERQEANRRKHVHACINILKIKSKHERIKLFFLYYPATGNYTAEELASDYNNLFWHFGGMVEGVTIQDFGYDGNTDYISPSSMLHHLNRLMSEGHATSKLWSRGWYARRMWSTHFDIPF